MIAISEGVILSKLKRADSSKAALIFLTLIDSISPHLLE